MTNIAEHRPMDLSARASALCGGEDGRDKAGLKRLRAELLSAQLAMAEKAKFQLIVVVAGMAGAGKGDTANLLHGWLDPHLLRTHGWPRLSDEERERPPMWRFWRVLPPRGHTAVFLDSWYTALLRRAAGDATSAASLPRCSEINAFERMLAAERVRILKLWFHLEQEEQRARLQHLAAGPLTRWRVSDDDWRENERYRPWRAAAERLLAATDAPYAPWLVIAAGDPDRRAWATAQALLSAMRAGGHGKQARRQAGASGTAAPLAASGRPQAVAFGPSLKKACYRRRLAAEQARLAALARDPRFRQRAAVVVFEGVDAAGKGGAIRRVLAALDARYYEVVPIGAPTDEERARPYLWRFWRHLPQRGSMTFFDRSWYGRLLVERVEKLTAERDWRRAYGEINNFEAELSRHGILVAKFYLVISRDEQLRRFKARRAVAYKRHKLTEADWRNRRNWSAYERAAADMLRLTHTEHAPWMLIAAEDKRHARIAVVRTLADRLAAAVALSPEP